MKRTTLSFLIACLCAGSMFAGPQADNVKDLGDEAKRHQAIERIAKAGMDAFDDLLDGLKAVPGGEGDALRAESQRRLYCARLIGNLGDTRASEELLRLFTEQATETSESPELAAAWAASLGAIWADQAASSERAKVASELARVAGYETVSATIRVGCLSGLARLRDGGAVAAQILGASTDTLLRASAIQVVKEAGHKAAADALLAIWEDQRLGPKNDQGARSNPDPTKYTLPVGVSALFTLASWGDARATDGLVDVATMNQFLLLAAARERAIELLKGDAFRAGALQALRRVLMADDRQNDWRQVAIALGDLGAEGVRALLSVANETVPEGKPEDHYKRRVDDQLSQLTSETALQAFAGAYETISAQDDAGKALREKILDQLLRYRTTLKGPAVAIFRAAANEETLEAPRRASAINAWCESKGRESLEDIKVWLKSEQAVIRAQAVQNAGSSYIPINLAEPLLVEALNNSAGDDFAKVRQNALRGLVRSTDKAHLALYLKHMDPATETNAEVRREALSNLATYRSNSKAKEEDYFEAMKARIADEDSAVRAAALMHGTGTAIRLGQKSAAVELVEKGLTDNAKDVRLAAYGQVASVADDLKIEKVVDAVLKETEPDARTESITALNNARGHAALATQDKRLESVVEMAVSIVETQRGREYMARQLLGKLDKEAGAFSIISRKVGEALDRNYGESGKYLDRVAALVPVLTEVKDAAAFPRVKQMAEEPNVELRRACIGYIGAVGTKDDIGFLRTLQDKADNVSVQLRADFESAIRALEGK